MFGTGSVLHLLRLVIPKSGGAPPLTGGPAGKSAVEFARELAGKAPQAMGLAKLVINNCVDVDLNTGRNFERLGQSVLKRTEDHKEGARAFIEKRPAAFSGR